jgi:hypothetical protein
MECMAGCKGSHNGVGHFQLGLACVAPIPERAPCKGPFLLLPRRSRKPAAPLRPFTQVIDRRGVVGRMAAGSRFEPVPFVMRFLTMRSFSLLLAAGFLLSTAAPAFAGPARRVAKAYGISVREARAMMRATGGASGVVNDRPTAIGPAAPNTPGSTYAIPGLFSAVGPAN